MATFLTALPITTYEHGRVRWGQDRRANGIVLPQDAVVREALEETGLATRIVSDLGMEHYDARPTKHEIHERYFFQLAPVDEEIPERWAAGEDNPSDGGEPQRWTCFWIPLEQSQVLCAGFGARLGRLIHE